MESRIGKWGNSPAIRLPAALMRAANLEPMQRVDILAEDGQLVIRPSKSKEFSLEVLVASISPENVHAESDFGPSVGKELL